MVNKNSTVPFWYKSKDEQDVLNMLGTAYTFALFLGYVNCATFQPTITMERVVYYREKASGIYSSMAYIIAQVKKSITNQTCKGKITSIHIGIRCADSS